MSLEKGRVFETIAAEYISANGYKILCQNWHFGKAEIDIIAQKEETLVVLEVKHRKTAFFGSPQSFISKAQQKRIIRAANAYVEKINWQGEVRFDVIGVVGSEKQHSLEHINMAFQPHP